MKARRVPLGDGGRTRRRDEQGSGTGLMIAVVGALLVGLGSVLGISEASGAVQRASSAADLSALAAADALRGITEGDPCSVAEELALSNGARVTECRIESADTLTVTVTVPLLRVLAGAGTAQAQARAGPPP